MQLIFPKAFADNLSPQEKKNRKQKNKKNNPDITKSCKCHFKLLLHLLRIKLLWLIFPKYWPLIGVLPAFFFIFMTFSVEYDYFMSSYKEAGFFLHYDQLLL